MNKNNVIIYCRVSSDEQKLGSSLEVQEANLRRYCEQSGYHIEQVYREDESAKTFDKRPEMQKLIAYNLYLRKFLVCPVCGHPYTGGHHKGRSQYYTYYYCDKDKRHTRSIPADDVNEGFARYVGSLTPNATVLALYKEVLDDLRHGDVRQRKEEIVRIEAELAKCEERINRVNDSYFDGDIFKDDRNTALTRYKKERDNLQNRINILKEANRCNIEPKLKYSISLIDNLEGFLRDAPVEVKIKLLGSIFPEKIVFDGKKYRTASFNKVLDLIY